MPIPASIADLSTTPASNSPAGGESPSLIDNYLREQAAYVAQLRDGTGFLTAVRSNNLGTTFIPAFSFVGDTDTGAWSPAANAYSVSVGGVEKLRVLSTGLHLDQTGGYFDRAALITMLRDIPGPIGINPSLHNVVTGNGDNSTFRGVSCGYFKAKDRAGVTTPTKGVLYGLQLSVEPSLDRNNFPFDDAVCLVLQNEGTGKGTEAIYVGKNGGIAVDFAAGLGLDANLTAGVYLTGTYEWAIDALWNISTPAVFNQGFARVPNNVTAIVGRNAANSADLPVIKLNASDRVELGGKEIYGVQGYLATPIGADGGSIGGLTINLARFSRINGMVHFNVSVTITAVGTATGSLLIRIPVQASSAGGIVTAANTSTSATLTGVIGALATQVRVSTAAGGSPISTGATIAVSGWYEAL